MKWIKYLSRTPLAQIRADWTEYVNLWRRCFLLRVDRYNAYDRIVAISNGAEDRLRQPSCIDHKYFLSDSLMARNGGSFGDNNMVFIKYSACGKFEETDGRTKCTKSECPCASRNHEYIDACERYDIVRRARRDFWREKFNQVKQNTK